MSEQAIRDFVSDFTEDDLRAVMLGSTVDVAKFTDIRVAKICAAHCILNGPVGIGKKTSFPGLEGEIAIRSLYEGRLSNRIWKNFCKVFAGTIVARHPDLANSCQHAVLHGAVWPLNEE
jgi:hypothetical protein